MVHVWTLYPHCPRTNHSVESWNQSLDRKWHSSQMFCSVSTWKEHFVECMMCNACHARYDLESFIRLGHGRCRVVVGVVLQVFMVMSPLRPVQIEGNVRRCQRGEDQVPIIWPESSVVTWCNLDLWFKVDFFSRFYHEKQHDFPLNNDLGILQQV